MATPRIRVSLVLVSLLLLGLSGMCWAQLYTGSLTGLVNDPSGAVVPGAKVTLTDVSKGFAHSATTDGVGRYVLRSLPPGAYKLAVEASGFKSFVQTGITIDVNQNSAMNVALQVGAATDFVEISATSPLLSTEDAVTGQNLNRTFINDLPLVNRGVFDLASLAPGVSQAPASTYGSGGSNNFVSNGSRNSTADILLDGVTTTNYEQNSGVQRPLYTPSPDAVQEFKVQQSNFSAENGFSGATVVNVITRSGGNQFHGSLYEFFRNQKLDANNFFSNRSGQHVSPLRWNNFGGTFGGPLRKDKLFFFADFDGSRNRTSATRSAGVPSAAMRAGDFGEVCAQAGGSFSAGGLCSVASGQLWDPNTGTYDGSRGAAVRTAFIPFNNLATYTSPGNPALQAGPHVIPIRPGNLMDPVAAKLMALYPLPNVGVGTASYNRFNNWLGSGSNMNSENKMDVKLDQRWSDKDVTSAKWSYAIGGRYQNANVFKTVGDTNTQGPGVSDQLLVAVNHNHVFSPSTLLSVSFGSSRSWSFTQGAGADPVTTLGMPPYTLTSGVKALPAIYINQYVQGGAASIGNQAWSLMKYGQEVHHLIGSLSHSMGGHELKFGSEARLHRINFLQAGAPAGVFNGYGWGTTARVGNDSSTGGDPMASFLFGSTMGTSWTGYEVPVAPATQNWQTAAFVQDNWRVNDKLTLNLGLRYDLDLPRTERYNRMTYLDVNAAAPVSIPAYPNLKGAVAFASASNRTVYDAQTNSIQPRVGLAYRLDNKTTIRGGYGIYYALTKGGAAGTGAGGFMGFNLQVPITPTYNWDNATPFGFLSDFYPGGPPLPRGAAGGPTTNLGGDVSGPVRAWNTTPQEQTWSFSIQRELPGGTLLETAYVGKKGTHLYLGGANNLNVLPPNVAAAFRANPSEWNGYVSNPMAGYLPGGSTMNNGSVQKYRLYLPYPQYNSIQGNDPPWANSIYHAFQLRLEKRLSNGLQFLGTYVFSKSIDNSSIAGSNTGWLGGATTSILDPNNLRLQRAVSEFDIPQVLQLSYVYQLPFGRGKKFATDLHPALNAVLGGWQTNGIWRFDNGQPIVLGVNGATTLPGYGARPNLSAALMKASNWTTSQYFANPQVASVPAAYMDGNAPRTITSVRQQGTQNISLALFKEFSLSRLREGARLEYRAEAFNALNHVQFGGLQTTVNQSTFGQFTSQANSPRSIQMALKMYF